MEHTYFLAAIIGIAYVVAGLSMLMHPKRVIEMVDHMEHNSLAMYLAGLQILILGLLIVLSHNVWGGLLAGLVTLTGWIMTLKGAVYLLFPNIIALSAGKKLATPGFLKFAGVLMVLLGAFLAHQGLSM